MKVKDLIEKLKEMPQDAELQYLYDGAARGNINIVYLANSGKVVASDYDEVIYYDEDRPVGAPDSSDVPYFHTPEI